MASVLTPEQKAQRAAYMREWRKANPEKARANDRVQDQRKKERDPEGFKAQAKERTRRYREKYPERSKETSNAWKRRQTAEYGRTQAKKWREANIELARARGREQYQKHKEARRAAVRNLKARRRGAPGTSTLAQVRGRFEFHGNRCIYCHATENLQVEHLIPLARGGTNWPANIAPACGTCNNRKHTKTYSEFKAALAA